MTARKSSLFTILAGGFMILLVTILASGQSPTDRSGAWLATLETPGGNLRLQVTVSIDDDGAQTAVLESLDQAPGQLIPVSTVAITEDRFEFSIAAIGARFEGEWNDAESSYDGVFSQGMQIPTSFARPTEDTAVFIDGMDGRWEGQLIRNDTELEFALNIQTGEDGTRVTLDSVSQAAYDIPVRNFSRSGDAVSFQVPAANVTYQGQLDGDSSSGDWMRPGFDTVTVTFDRVSETVEAPNRPQTPQAPFPYTIEEVRIDNPDAEGVTLAGSLTLPEGEGPFPGVVLISGSGPQDRDETVWTHQPFAVLADSLTRRGIAVLRYDDRGFADSTGDFASATSYDFASDAAAVAEWMRNHPLINAVGLAGHSEGGLIAPIVAAEHSETAFIILLAGPGTPGHRFIIDQIMANSDAMGIDSAETRARVAVMETLVDAVRHARDQDSAEAALDGLLTEETLSILEVPADQKAVFISSMSRDWYRELVNYDPADWFARVDQPVLALQGTLDLQIVAEPNVAGLETLLADKPDAQIVVLEGRNHLFQNAQTGLMTEYAQIEETFDPEVMALIADWINERFGAER
ncbi:alpha/beta hydrolase family protein [Oceanicaulis sp.]|uniref:alpha/beta hydrolase family protein n=1 Tax=Oceanicaulis sp. TaxID=1924941 RepID=UPI003D27DBA1